MRFPWSKKSALTQPDLQSAAWLFGMGGIRTMAQRYEVFATEGYAENPIAFACVDKLASAMGSVDLLVYKRGKDGKVKKIEGEHPLKQLIASKPNPLYSGRTFIDNLARYWLIGGNAYVLGTGLDTKKTQPPKELYLLNPGKVSVVAPTTKSPFPERYDYTATDGVCATTSFEVNPITGRSAVLHIKTFHPLNPWMGLSPMVTAARGVDIFNAGQQWNLRLLQNEARPSGAMVVTGNDNQPATLSQEQYTRLKTQIEDQFSGSKNAGRPMLLEGGLDWRQMSMTAKDMDHEKNMLNNARFTASVYGVPPMLVNIPGESTYANFESARTALWTDSVLPKLGFILDELNRWLAPLYGDDIFIWYDEEMIPALEMVRKEKAERINAAEYMTVNEKREAMGLGTLGKIGDVVLVPTTDTRLDLVGSPNPADAQANADRVRDEAEV